MNNFKIVKNGYINEQKRIDAIPNEELYTKEKLREVLLKNNLYKKQVIRKCLGFLND